jgi:hypothetical protein
MKRGGGFLLTEIKMETKMGKEEGKVEGPL